MIVIVSKLQTCESRSVSFLGKERYERKAIKRGEKDNGVRVRGH